MPFFQKHVVPIYFWFIKQTTNKKIRYKNICRICLISIYATALCYYAGQYVFLPGFLLFEFKPKTNQKSKNHNKKHIVPNDINLFNSI